MKTACDLCQESLPLLEGWFSCPDPHTGHWLFVCKFCPDGFYDFSAELFFQSPESIAKWIRHLSEKRWFDLQKFYQLLDRLERSETLCLHVWRS
jgi:hypothetical protein